MSVLKPILKQVAAMFVKKKEVPTPVALTPLEQPRVAAPPVQQPFQQPGPPPARPKPASMFGQGLTIRGDVVGDVEVHLDCVVLGDVKVGKLIVGPNARIEGSVVSQATEIHGLVIGAVTAQSVRLYSTARVDGDITHEQLAMETGAEFQGRSMKFRRPAPAQPQPAPAPAQAQPFAQAQPQPQPQAQPQPVQAQAHPQAHQQAYPQAQAPRPPQAAPANPPSASQTPYSHVSH
jgi:cytoskeletal protein CcmA (bactofilin family)